MTRYLIMDVDGTLTDGKIYMGADGEVMKAFSVKDGYAIHYILKPADIVPVVITAREGRIVQRRCNEIGIEKVYQGKKDKAAVLKEAVGDGSLGDCAYFGDDVLDLECMLLIKGAGGVVGCPFDAVREVKAIAGYVCANRAGEGALREFSEWLVHPGQDEKGVHNRVQVALEYLLGLEITEADIGKHVVDNDFFYLVQTPGVGMADENKLGSHRRYVDIQIVVQGVEALDIVDVSGLTVKEEYDPERDVVFWNIPPRMSRVALAQGSHIILYPENAHRRAILPRGEIPVMKIVGKVKIK